MHILDTSFGGGKTHTIIALHLFFSKFKEAIDNPELYKIASELNITEDPEIIVVGIDGHNSPIRLNIDITIENKLRNLGNSARDCMINSEFIWELEGE